MANKNRLPELSKVARPRKEAPYPRRDFDCEQALGAAFHELVDSAVAAGWNELEILVALHTLAEAEIAFSLQNGEGALVHAGPKAGGRLH